MTAVAALTLGGQVTGLPAGTMAVTAVWNAPTASGEIINVVLATGDNTIAIPSGSTLVLITPPLANTATLCLKGAGSDYGLTFAPTMQSNSQPIVLPIQPAQTSLIINSSAPVAGVTSFLFV